MQCLSMNVISRSLSINTRREKIPKNKKRWIGREIRTNKDSFSQCSDISQILTRKTQLCLNQNMPANPPNSACRTRIALYSPLLFFINRPPASTNQRVEKQHIQKTVHNEKSSDVFAAGAGFLPWADHGDGLQRRG